PPRVRVCLPSALIVAAPPVLSFLSLHDALPICPGLHVEPLLEDRSLLVARRDHPSAAAGKLSRRALADLRHVRVDMVPGKRFGEDRKSTRLNSSHGSISYAVFCLKKKKTGD